MKMMKNNKDIFEDENIDLDDEENFEENFIRFRSLFLREMFNVVE